MHWWVAILVALIAATPATLAWLQSRATLAQSKKNHEAVNGRLDEFMKVRDELATVISQIRSRSARARGRREGLAEGKRKK